VEHKRRCGVGCTCARGTRLRRLQDAPQEPVLTPFLLTPCILSTCTRIPLPREIAAAVSFISKFLRTKGLTSERQLQTFSQSLQELLAEHYKHHWFPEKPCKGSGYRCIRINHKMDPLIGQAAQRIGLSSQELFRLLPSELTLWVDPYEVSYRIGEDGSICVLYEASPAGGSTQNSTNVQMVDSRISCKEELLLGRTSPSKNYNMMTVSVICWSYCA
ncbi:hypothetical protein EI555_010014, partial [Monodon monoceros]